MAKKRQSSLISIGKTMWSGRLIIGDFSQSLKINFFHLKTIFMILEKSFLIFYLNWGNSLKESLIIRFPIHRVYGIFSSWLWQASLENNRAPASMNRLNSSSFLSEWSVFSCVMPISSVSLSFVQIKQRLVPTFDTIKRFSTMSAIRTKTPLLSFLSILMISEDLHEFSFFYEIF